MAVVAISAWHKIIKIINHSALDITVKSIIWHRLKLIRYITTQAVHICTLQQPLKST